jgi:hypothetical protein
MPRCGRPSTTYRDGLQGRDWGGQGGMDMAQISRHMPRSMRTDARAISYEPGLQAFWALRIGFTVAPLVAGLD